ncbi:hypothetical protein ACGLHS_31565 [Variovorax sp. VaC1]|uniref:hypothetical protein n=1 Tax=Variovorax sp. VaC1 TaxID=3373132 RepID=UPI00374A4140
MKKKRTDRGLNINRVLFPRSTKRVTRAALIRAFSSPGQKRGAVMAVVKQYMGDSQEPPTWSKASVLGTFGKRIARQWARHIRHLAPAGNVFVQTFYDFGMSPEQARQASARMEGQSDDSVRAPVPAPLLLLDEFHRAFAPEVDLKNAIAMNGGTVNVIAGGLNDEMRATLNTAIAGVGGKLTWI